MYICIDGLDLQHAGLLARAGALLDDVLARAAIQVLCTGHVS